MSATRPTVIEIDADERGLARVTRLQPGDLVSARPVHRDGPRVRIALLGRQMSLLGGDRLALRVRLGPGVSAELIEPAGLVAYDAAGRASRWELTGSLGPGARLRYDAAPCVAAQGSALTRRTRLDLAAGARAVLAETLVLGRTGETGSPVGTTTRITHDGAPLLVEDLVTGPVPGTETSLWRDPAVLAGHRTLVQAMALGFVPDPDTPGLSAGPADAGMDLEAGTGALSGNTEDPEAAGESLHLAGPGILWRWMGEHAHRGRAALEPVLHRWLEAMDRPEPSDRPEVTGRPDSR